MPAILSGVHDRPVTGQDDRRQRLDEDFRRSFNHENKKKPSGDPPLKLKKSEQKQPGKDERK
ncbi:MAG: hypothetical protein RLZZ54_716 [Cyanobacteriota bacterium]|jgi:hypothetical protein